MKIRRTDREDMEDTNELLAKALTEDLAIWLADWLGAQPPVSFEAKSSIYYVIMERFKKGIEI